MMDSVERNDENQVGEISLGQYLRPRLRQPLELQAVQGGMVFEIDDDEEDWDLIEDHDDENYEDDTYELFQSFVPSDSKMRFGNETAEQKGGNFDGAAPAEIDFDELEQQMIEVNEDGTVKKMIIKFGNGEVIPSNCRVYFHYCAIAENSDEPFDTTLIRKYPQRADLRQTGGMLPGLEIAVRSMELREAARFIVDPLVGYGELGCSPRVPPNSRILFIVETLQIINEKTLNTPLYMPAEERNVLPFRVLYDLSDRLRTEGNGHYVNGFLQFALKKWRRGIQILEEYPASDMQTCIQRSEILHTMYTNVAQAYIKLDRPAQACNACKLGLRLISDVHACKLYYRFAKAKLMLKDCDAAMSLVEDGLALDGRDKDLLQLAKEIQVEEKTQTKSNKRMWSKLFKSKVKAEEIFKSNTPGSSKGATPGSSKSATPGPSKGSIPYTSISDISGSSKNATPRSFKGATSGSSKILSQGATTSTNNDGYRTKVKLFTSTPSLVKLDDANKQCYSVNEFLHNLENMPNDEDQAHPDFEIDAFVRPGSSEGAIPRSSKGATPGSSKGATPGSSKGATPGSSKSATPGSSKGATTGPSKGSIPYTSISDISGSSKNATPQSSKGATLGSSKVLSQGATKSSNNDGYRTKVKLCTSAPSLVKLDDANKQCYSVNEVLHNLENMPNDEEQAHPDFETDAFVRPGSSKGATPGSSEFATPGSSKGAIPGSSKGATPGPSKGSIPYTSISDISGSSKNATPQSFKGATSGSSKILSQGATTSTNNDGSKKLPDIKYKVKLCTSALSLVKLDDANKQCYSVNEFATPGPSKGTTPGSSKGATPGPSKGATPGPSKGATPGPSKGATPYTSIGDISGSSKIATPQSSKGATLGSSKVLSQGATTSTNNDGCKKLPDIKYKVKLCTSALSLVKLDDANKQCYSVNEFLHNLETMPNDEEQAHPDFETDAFVRPYLYCSDEVRFANTPEERALSLLPPVCFDNFEPEMETKEGNNKPLKEEGIEDKLN